MKHQKRFEAFLSEHNLKNTPQRGLVWQVLVEAEDHPSVEEIRERLLERGNRIGLTTIYRTLKMLLDSGMIRQVRLGGVTRYEPLINQPNHIHFVCNRCGRTDEFPSRRIERLIREETDKHDFQPLYSRYAIFGLCCQCVGSASVETDREEKNRQEKILARDALELTLAVERRGYSFYTNAARKTLDPGGREMFEQLAKEESEHLERFGNEYRKLIAEHGWLRQEPTRLPAARKIADEIFPERELLSVDVGDETSAREALRIAIDLERKSHRFFESFARELSDPRGRKIFRDVAREEQTHLESLRKEYARLGRTSKKVVGSRTRKSPRA